MNGPIMLAIVAGGLSTINPCGFAMLPAFLGMYAGAREEQLPSGPTRLAQGVATGLLVAAGFLAVFAAVALPIIYGATQIVRAVPFAGIALGFAMILFGIATAVGFHVRLSIANPVQPGEERKPKAMFLFGMGYGIASLGCTLPVFLAVVGASLATGGAAEGLQVLIAYGFGMTVVLVVLAVAAAMLREGIARGMRRLLPYMDRISGTMLILAGAYLTYYWGRVKFGSAATLNDDPIVGFVGRFTASIERFADGNGRTLMLIVGILGVSMLAVAGAQWFRSDHDGLDDNEDPDDNDSDTFISDRLDSDPTDEELSVGLEPAGTRIGNQ
jgi:cytochrome c-type biogenesis protein